MDKYNLLKELIAIVDEVDFEKEAILSANDLISKLYKDLKKVEDDKLFLHTQNPNTNINNEIGRYITRTNRFASIYAKDILKDLPYVSLNDFGFVALLHANKQLSKTALIKLVLMDKSPGMEIIKRLVSKNVMEEFENKNDKRSKMLRLTTYGEEVVLKSYEKMTGLSNSLLADLDEITKFEILKILKYLDGYHQKKVGDLV
jgi:MarR family transcriptional regulator, lower aerobic nicotinate degradation pathway regulator